MVNSIGLVEMTKTQEDCSWDVHVLKIARKEGKNILNQTQYDHVVEVLKRLTDWEDKEEISDLRIEKIQDFYELKDKGGVLGRLNLRVYFATVPDNKDIIVLKTYKKEEDGACPRYIIINVEDRLEDFLSGNLQEGVITYKAKSEKT